MKYVWFLAPLVFAGALRAQSPAPPPAGHLLNITILDGDESILNTRKRDSRESIVQVQDENHKPVAGAILVLRAPDSGAGATFGDSSFTQTFTDANGKAVIHIRPNQVAGRYSVNVTASKDGVAAHAEIHLTNVTPPPATVLGMSAKTFTLVMVGVGAAAAAGAGIALGKGGGSTPGAGEVPTPQRSGITLQQGTATVGPPR